MRKQLFITIILSAFCLFSSFDLLAAKISGTVVDEKNEPLAGVTVVIKSLQKGTQTDADGKYEIDGVDDGTYEVLFSLITFKKSLQTVTIIKGKDEELNATLKEEGRNLSEVTVKSTKLSNTENAVIMEMRKSNSMVSAISAQQISKTMDRNAADVVKRVPGVTIMDDKFIMVRGLYDRYNSVWLNDVGAPSSEVDKKAFSFDVIPSGQIDRIVVAKTPAPDLPGDFAGGMVKIYTTSIPSKNSYTAGLQVSKREFSTGSSFNYNQPSKTDWLGYDNGSRAMPSNLPNMFDKTDPNIESISKSFKNNWGINTKSASPDLRFNFSAANVFKASKKVQMGNVFAVNYTNTNTNYNILRNDYDSASLGEAYKDKASVNNVNAAVMENLAARWGNNKIEFKNLLNQIGRSALVDRYNIPDTAKQEGSEHDYIMSYESRRIFTSQLTGTHKSNDDRRSYTWALGYTNLYKNLPDLRRIRYTKQYGQEDSFYTAAVPVGAVDPVYGGARVYQQLHENAYVFNHQFSQKIRIKKYEFEAFAGNYIEYKERKYELRQFGYTITNKIGGKTNPYYGSYRRLPIGQIFEEDNLGGLGQFKMEESTSPYDKYDANNTLVASYLAVKLPVGDHLSIYGGARDEYNKYVINSYTNLNLVSTPITTNFILPSVNISYNLTDKQLVRLAYGKTLNRPEFRENSPSYFYDLESRWGIYGAMYPSNTNGSGDTLKVAQIQNFDARWEWYPSNSEVIQVGVFYKDLKDPIQQVIDKSGGDSRAITFTNMDKAYSYGAELDIRKNFEFIDNWANTDVFKDFAFVGNAAIIKSQMTPSPRVDTRVSPIQGQSPYMYNAGLYYQGDSLGLQASILYNVFGPRIYALGKVGDKVGNVWELPFNSLDFTVSKTFFKYVTISAGIQNLLNQSVRTAQDANYDNKIDKDVNNPDSIDKLITSYKPGRYYTVGVRVKI
ncbi:MAG: TonB-dependent receptor [Bacteroidetes bacterium]|nr:TonB-dependent receptor [Bacteroidota bacterium]